MNKSRLIVIGSLLLVTGGVMGFVVTSLVQPFGARARETANLRTELADTRAELQRAKQDVESARAELTRTTAEADLSWARQVAELFLNSVSEGGDEGPALAVCTKDCRARQVGFGAYVPFINPEHGFRSSIGKLSWSITSHVVSPARDRVAFHGTMEGRPGYWGPHEFQLMLLKENGGEWKVSEFVCQEKRSP